MEILKIQCPVCGIILEVKNSKNEAVKRIVCPNCKKTLAVTFHDEAEAKPRNCLSPLPVLFYGQMRIELQEGANQMPLPDSEGIAVRVVRLKDGNCKCLVSANRENTVRVNDEYLLAGDEVALSDGDLLRFGNTTLSFNKPVETGSVGPVPPTDETKTGRADNPLKHKIWWIAVAACMVVLMLMAVVKFWPKEEKTVITSPPVKVEKEENAVQNPGHTGSGMSGGNNGGGEEKKVNRIDYDKLSDLELELRAKDDVTAQFKIGKRYVNRKDSINIVKGTNYLKLARRNGSAEARKALLKVELSLRRDADNGNSHAANLLEVINDER